RPRGPPSRPRPRARGEGVSSFPPVAVQPVPRGGLGRMVGRRAVDWLPALVVFVGIIALWQGLIDWLHVQQFLLPKPTSIASAFWTDKHELWSAGWYTFQEALGGFVLGSAAGECAHALRDRRQRDPDHRLRADHEPVVRRRPHEELEDRDRRRSLLLS